MAQQPIPTIGSVTLIFHLIVNASNSIRKNTTFFLIIFISFVLLMVSIFWLNQLKNKNTNIIVKPIAKDKKANEKYETITDMSFINDQHWTAWVGWWDEDRAVNSLQTSINKIDTLSPLWYTVDANGLLKETLTKRKYDITHIAANSTILVIPTINNEAETGFDPKRISKLLNNKQLQVNFVQSLIGIAKNEGYSGWDIDWEQKKIEDKENFSKLIQSVASELHKNRLTLSVTVQQKVEEQVGTFDDTSDDWHELAKYADEIRIMVYDFHYDASESGPITPLNELEAVLDYAIKVIPLNKITLGVPMYGYDWDDQKGEAIQYEDGMNRIKKNNGSFVRDPETEEIIGKYLAGKQEHNLWFTDTKSIIRILYIADNYDIKRIAFWRLGGEDGSIWKVRR